MKRCLQIVVMAVIGALLANAQCFAYCSTALCVSPVAGAKGHCHQNSRNSGQSESPCLHHHSQTFGPESGTDIAKLAEGKIFHCPPAVVVPQVALLPATHESWMTLDAASPPHTKAFLSLSILRI